MKVCYFTATGNCLQVARALGGELLSIPQLMRQEEIELADEAVGIVAPVYAGEMPMMVRSFMERANIETDYLFFVYTYGMGGHEEAMCHAELVARERGWKLTYANAVQMVDNYLPGFEMRDQMATLPDKDVEGHLARVAADITARRERPVEITPKLEANMAMFSERLAKRILRKEAARDYTVSDACVRCGICARVCPARNVRVTDGGVEFGDACEVCYACIQNCPQGAIHLPDERSEARFRNERVSLADIVAANG